MILESFYYLKSRTKFVRFNVNNGDFFKKKFVRKLHWKSLFKLDVTKLLCSVTNFVVFKTGVVNATVVEVTMVVVTKW